ncbi:MAG: arginyltransferase [Pseudomonadales bacterium]
MKDQTGSHQFFLTPGHPCSYLPGREARTLFLDPRDTVSAEIYQGLAERGFRRSGGHLYRPHCEHCRACVPARIPVDGFMLRRRHRRVMRVNADLEVRIEAGAYNPIHYELYARYISARHADGDMYPPSQDQFRSFLLSQWSNTRFLCSYLEERLVAVAVMDEQPAGFAAVYTFFDPLLSDRSLGVFSILSQIDHCRRMGVPHLYLGYWIRDAQKMRYKVDYRPVELLVQGRWVRLS